jgi:hypothetical protein
MKGTDGEEEEKKPAEKEIFCVRPNTKANTTQTVIPRSHDKIYVSN